MKSLDEYLKWPYPMLFRPIPDEGGFLVSFPDLPGCITVGDTIEEAYANAQDAKKTWFETLLETGVSINEPNSYL